MIATIGIIFTILFIIALWLDLKDKRLNSPKEKTREERYTKYPILK